MEHVPQIAPISNMRLRHREVLAMLDDGPVILSQRGKAAAVLLSVGSGKISPMNLSACAA